MIDRVALKTMAKQQIKGNIGILFVMSLIVFGICLVAGFIPVVGNLVSSWVLTPAFTLSLIMVYIALTKGVKPEIARIFDGFYDLWCVFKVMFFVGLFTLLWSLLFIVPGIIKGYSYSMALYILAENKGMPALEAIRQSKKMMDGHKMDLFVLELSFIGWALLCCITFGIAYIWVAPYMMATYANFYNTIKGETKDETVEVQAETVQEEETVEVQAEVVQAEEVTLAETLATESEVVEEAAEPEAIEIDSKPDEVAGE